MRLFICEEDLLILAVWSASGWAYDVEKNLLWSLVRAFIEKEKVTGN
jgi:hypothetical protein